MQKDSTTVSDITVFGEVLFDCFDDGEQTSQVLGGAPFNISWHLQALGDQPRFISRVGDDELGRTIIQYAQDWGLDTHYIQTDSLHPTGVVQVTLVDNEPQYHIKEHQAYDYIDTQGFQAEKPSGILYHGSLALRSKEAQQQFAHLTKSGNWSIFLDVNLRAPWWDKPSLEHWLQQARWVKLNIDELHQLGFDQQDLATEMRTFRERYPCEQLIVTLGAQGASVLSDDGFINQAPDPITEFVDTVGAGDAFTSVYLHGLMHQWPLRETLHKAQTFASKIIGIQGATPQDKTFYKNLID